MAEVWHDLTRQARLRLPPRVRNWVALESSMTERIGKVADRPIAVEVLRQASGQLLADEHRFFPTAAGCAMVREVCLSAEGRPLLIARSVFTSQRLQTHPTILKLGNRPLGSLLFSGGKPSPYTAREFARIDHAAPLFGLVRQRHRGLCPHYWARRTLFYLFDAPLLVTEIFLPDLIHHPRATRV
jgi:chorismate--pyruvate lyase